MKYFIVVEALRQSLIARRRVPWERLRIRLDQLAQPSGVMPGRRLRLQHDRPAPPKTLEARARTRSGRRLAWLAGRSLQRSPCFGFVPTAGSDLQIALIGGAGIPVTSVLGVGARDDDVGLRSVRVERERAFRPLGGLIEVRVCVLGLRDRQGQGRILRMDANARAQAAGDRRQSPLRVDVSHPSVGTPVSFAGPAAGSAADGADGRWLPHHRGAWPRDGRLGGVRRRDRRCRSSAVGGVRDGFAAFARDCRHSATRGFKVTAPSAAAPTSNASQIRACIVCWRARRCALSGPTAPPPATPASLARAQA